MFEEGERLRRRLGREGVFDLSLGNPVLEPPAELRETLLRLLAEGKAGMHRYSPNAGWPEARARVAAWVSRDSGLRVPAECVVLTCGAAGGMNVVLKALLNPGDEVVVPAPFFPEYRFYVENHGGVLRPVPTRPDFQLDLESVERWLGPRTRAVILNSPNNPTGVVYDREGLEGLVRLLEPRGTWLIADEPYRDIVYEGPPPHPFSLYERALVVSSFSKNLCIPGERIGYVAVHPRCPGRAELLEALVFANRILGFVNAPALMQRLLVRLPEVPVPVAAYRRKRDRLYEALRSFGYEVVRPGGAFYLFPRSPLADDLAFTRLLQRHGVLVVPGRGFGAPGYFRIAYCVEDEVIEGAIARFRTAAEQVRCGSC